MPKSSLYAIAGGIADALRATGAFESVTVAPISSGPQLGAVLEALTRFPAAAVAISGAEFEEEGLVRSLRVLVIVADRFRRGADARAAGAWSLVEKIELLAENGLLSCGIPFTPVQWDAVEMEDLNVCAFAVTLTGAEA